MEGVASTSHPSPIPTMQQQKESDRRTDWPEIRERVGPGVLGKNLCMGRVKL